MKTVITGISKIDSGEMEDEISKLHGITGKIRYVHDLDKLMVAGIGLLLKDTKIEFPVRNDDISLYIGVDDSIEDIKDEFFKGILEEGILGASPLLFPFTSPNALTAQASIAFDIRGESIVMPIQDSFKDVIEYAVECISGNYSTMAITGGILSGKNRKEKTYKGEFYFLESDKSALKRKARIYRAQLPEKRIPGKGE